MTPTLLLIFGAVLTAAFYLGRSVEKFDNALDEMKDFHRLIIRNHQELVKELNDAHAEQIKLHNTLLLAQQKNHYEDQLARAGERQADLVAKSDALTRQLDTSRSEVARLETEIEQQEASLLQARHEAESRGGFIDSLTRFFTLERKGSKDHLPVSY